MSDLPHAAQRRGKKREKSFSSIGAKIGDVSIFWRIFIYLCQNFE